MPFRDYQTNTPISVRRQLEAAGLKMAPHPVLAASVELRQGRLRLNGFGPLRELTGSDRKLPLLLSEGVGYRELPQSRGALAVWGDGDEVSYDTATRLLTMTTTENGAKVTLEIDIPPELDVVVFSDNPDSDDCVWAPRIGRIRKWAHESTEYLYPYAPVTEAAWPYVESSRIEFAQDHITWEVEFVGDVKKELRVPVRGGRFVGFGIESSAESLSGEAEVQISGLAIWPPFIVKGWRLYSIASQNLFDRNDLEAEIWVGTSGRPPHRRLRQSELIGTPQKPEGALLAVGADESEGPRFIHLSRSDGASGYFELLTDTLADTDGQPRVVALDFGTSTTTVAYGTEETLDFLGNDETMKKFAAPRVIVPNADGVCEFPNPWILTARIAGTKANEQLEERITELPTSLYKRTSRTPTVYPFIDYALLSASFDLTQAGDADRKRWSSGLKWSASAADRNAFLSAVLLWTAALLRPTSRQLTIRATYPLAFTMPQIDAYGSLLATTATEVSRLTGVNVNVASPRSLGDSGNGPRPFTDESTPLLGRARERIEIAGVDQQIPFVFIADLGGETLDVQLSCVDLGGSRANRIVASESIRIGANCLVDHLERQYLVSDRRDHDNDNGALRNAIVMRIIRMGKFRDAIVGGLGKENRSFLGTTLSWNEPGSASDFTAMADLYFGLIAEYCARFVAGTLKNRADLLRRISQGPGEGMVPTGPFETNEPLRVAIQPFLVGNGWKLLRGLLHCLPHPPVHNVNEWLNQFLFSRISDLATPTHVTAIIRAGMDLDGKTETALGTLNTGIEEQRLSGQVLLPILSAPNGFAERIDGVNYDWTTYVGPGDKTLKEPLQTRTLDDPPFPPAAKLLLTRAGQKRYDTAILRLNVPRNEQDRQRVRQHQLHVGPRAANDARHVSASRSVWETIIRGHFTEPVK